MYEFLKPILDKLVASKAEFIIKFNGAIYLTYNGNTGQQYAYLDPILNHDGECLGCYNVRRTIAYKDGPLLTHEDEVTEGAILGVLDFSAMSNVTSFSVSNKELTVEFLTLQFKKLLVL